MLPQLDGPAPNRKSSGATRSHSRGLTPAASRAIRPPLQAVRGHPSVQLGIRVLGLHIATTRYFGDGRRMFWSTPRQAVGLARTFAARAAATPRDPLRFGSGWSALEMYKFSEKLAWVAGVVLPVGETLRRWGTWWDAPMAYVDDLLVGLFFLLAAWASRRAQASGGRWLAASFGFGCGMGYSSLASAVENINRLDPSGASGTTAAAVKACMLALGVVGLVGAVRRRSA